MKTAIVPTARNSDCQFWNVSSQKSDEVAYVAHETVGWSWSRCSSFYSVHPVTDCVAQVAKKIAVITISSEFW